MAKYCLVTAFRLSGCQRWETNPNGETWPQLCTSVLPRKGWELLQGQRCSGSAGLLNSPQLLPLLLEKSAEQVYGKIQRINLCFFIYRTPESKSDESFECYWNADHVTEVWFKRHIPIFLNPQNKMLMTGQACDEFPQAATLLTDSVNILIKALTEE